MSSLFPRFAVTFTLAAGLCFVVACKTRAWNDTDSGAKHFKPLKYEAGIGQKVEMILRHAGGIRHDVYVRRIDLTKDDGEKDLSKKERFENHIDVHFGKLATKEEFDALIKTYRGNPSHPFDPEREYQLVDFLPPTIQATVGKRFRTQEEFVEGVSGVLTRGGKVFTMGNCWTTAYEVIRADPKAFTLFHIGEFQGCEALSSPEHSRQIKVIEKEMFDPDKGTVRRNEGLQPFDVLLVYSPVDNFKPDGAKKLSHAAVYIDDDLYFEKSGSESLYPYRIETS